MNSDKNARGPGCWTRRFGSGLGLKVGACSSYEPTLSKIDRIADLDLDRIVFTYPTRLPRHCTPPRAIPSSHRRHTTPRHLSSITHPPPRPRSFSASTSYASTSSTSSSTSPVTFRDLVDLIRPLCGTTPREWANPDGAWEAFLALVEDEGVVVPWLVKGPLLMFANRLVDGTFTISCDTSSTPAEKMASRAAKVRRILEAITDSSHPPRQQLEIFEARCMALEGRFGEAEVILNRHCGGKGARDPEHALPLLQIPQAIIRAIEILHGPEAAYDWLVSRWEAVEQHIWPNSRLVYSRAGQHAYANLRETLTRVVDRIENHGDFLTEGVRTRPDGPWREVGKHFIATVSAMRMPEEALGVIRQMERLSIPPPIGNRIALVRALAKEKSFGPAHELYAKMYKERKDMSEPMFRRLLGTGLYLHAREGSVEEAREVFERLRKRGWVDNRGVALMLHATSVKGLVKETIETFERFFPRRASCSQYEFGKPTVAHYTEVLFALTQAGDMDNVPVWLERMGKDGVIPDLYLHVILLKSFSSSQNDLAFFQLLKGMRSSGIKPNLQVYTTVLSLLTRKGDSVGVERTFQSALKDGIKPDIIMLNVLMHSHVQSGYWQGVIDTFNYVMTLPGRRHRPTTATYNVLLKAYVLLRAQFPIVRDLMAKQEALGTRPDAYTYALLIQSACDNKEFDTALSLLDKMDRLAASTGSKVTVYVLTILMGAFLRHGDKVRALMMFEQMKSRNIIPTATTYSSIIRAYAEEKSPESLQLAEAFLKQLIAGGSGDDGLRAGWASSSCGRGLALRTLYWPLMRVYGDLQRIEDVERLQQDLLEQGGRTTLGGLVALLAAHRNVAEVKAGREIWSLIFDMASQSSKLGDILSSDDTESESGSSAPREAITQTNILCVPLSIYIDLLSSTGNHTEVAMVWDQLQTHGFTFDSHNWNHLIVALIRAGEPERAFQVLERVILPNASPTSSAGEAEYGREHRQPDPLLSIVNGNNGVILPVQEGSAAEPPAWEEVTAHEDKRRVEDTSELMESYPTIDAAPGGDFVRGLKTLQLIPVAWSSWQPHVVTLSVLSHALTSLASGKPIHPIQGGPVSSELPSSTDKPTPNSEDAKAVLNRIYVNYPQAVEAVKGFGKRWAEKLEHEI